MWSQKLGRVRIRARETGLGHGCVVLFERVFRQITAEYFRRNQPIIGGPGMTVELDETCVFKPKYQRGRRFRKHRWLFGGVERGSGRCFVALVKKRDANALLNLISRHVRPGTTVITDM